LDTLISIATEDELSDYEFCREIVKRAINEKRKSVIKTLFEKIASVFIFRDQEKREKVIKAIYSALKNFNLQQMIEVGKETTFGNVLVIYYFTKKYKVITPENIDKVVALSELRFINDPFVLELVPLEDQMIIDLDERVGELDKQEIAKAAKICELLFVNNLLLKNEDAIKGMLILYQNSNSPELKFKGQIISSLLKRNLALFMKHLESLGKKIKNEYDLLASYDEIYDILVRINVPVFFDYKSIKFNNVLYNGNFYFLKFIDTSGNEKFLFPFEQVEFRNIQKIYDLNTAMYITPKKRIGKVLVHEIFSFRKITTVTKVLEANIKIVQNMSENEIEKKIREILKDQNITPHGPAERADIFTTKLFINNKRDLRNSAFIIKGKSYPKVNLEAIASNLLKAILLPVDIIFLVHTGILLDEPQNIFIQQCNKYEKMYCIIGPIELTRLLIAYNKL